VWAKKLNERDHKAEYSAGGNTILKLTLKNQSKKEILKSSNNGNLIFGILYLYNFNKLNGR
jgi:hypothetical protein